MAFYEIGWVSTATGANSPLAAFRAPTRQSRLWEMGITLNAATASLVSLFRNTAGGYSANASSSVGQQENPTDAAGTSLVDTGWSTAPTINAASRLRRYQLPATIGAGLIWTFRNGIWVRGATATDILVLWNEGGSACSVLNGYCVWEE